MVESSTVQESECQQAICDKRPALHIESSVPAMIVVGALVLSIAAFIWMAWKFELLRKAIPEFVTE